MLHAGYQVVTITFHIHFSHFFLPFCLFHIMMIYVLVALHTSALSVLYILCMFNFYSKFVIHHKLVHDESLALEHAPVDCTWKSSVYKSLSSQEFGEHESTSLRSI